MSDRLMIVVLAGKLRVRMNCIPCRDVAKVWYNPAGTPGSPTLSATDGDIGWGGVALAGWDALFDNLKVGYDADDDDDLDGSDDVVLDEDFAAATVSPTHDDAGNLTKDADYAYVYDGWNNLVKVRAQNDADVVVGVYAYYADNRRASKVVSHRGELDGTTYFFYDGLREIEERNGSEAVTQQYVWGHEYIDQLLMIRGANGTWFVHQDANWNVIALTTPGGDVAEEVQYQPYGLPQVRRHLAFGNADADGDVDSADNTARTNALSTYNRTFDADFDGDVSNTGGDADQEAWDASYTDPDASITMVVANRAFSPTGNPFLFTGRRLDAETGLYFYRFRTYHPVLKTFIQRDPLGYVDSASLYQYVGGMPTAAGDPLGLSVIVGQSRPEDKPKPKPTSGWPGNIGKGTGEDKDDGITGDCEHEGNLQDIRQGAEVGQLKLYSGQAGIVAEEAAQLGIIVVGLYIPDPTDAILAAILAREGILLLKVAGKWVVKQGGKILDARRARIALARALEEAKKEAAAALEEIAKRLVKLTRREIRELQAKGIDIHDLKGGGEGGASWYNLFKDQKTGKIYVW